MVSSIRTGFRRCNTRFYRRSKCKPDGICLARLVSCSRSLTGRRFSSTTRVSVYSRATLVPRNSRQRLHGRRRGRFQVTGNRIEVDNGVAEHVIRRATRCARQTAIQSATYQHPTVAPDGGYPSHRRPVALRLGSFTISPLSITCSSFLDRSWQFVWVCDCRDFVPFPSSAV